MPIGFLQIINDAKEFRKFLDMMEETWQVKRFISGLFIYFLRESLLIHSGTSSFSNLRAFKSS